MAGGDLILGDFVRCSSRVVRWKKEEVMRIEVPSCAG